MERFFCFRYNVNVIISANMIKTVEDLMSDNVITVTPETPLPEAAILLTRFGFRGLPVVDKDNKVVGMFAERNMVSDESYTNLKTLLKLFSEMEFYKRDNSPIREDLNRLNNIKVKDVMTPYPKTVHPEDELEQTVVIFNNPENNPLPVVDKDGRLRGILGISDLTRMYGVASKKSNLTRKEVDKEIDQFVNKFGKQFLVVSRFRVSTWFIVSLMFAFAGFAVAMFLILRISFE